MWSQRMQCSRMWTGPIRSMRALPLQAGAFGTAAPVCCVAVTLLLPLGACLRVRLAAPRSHCLSLAPAPHWSCLPVAQVVRSSDRLVSKHVAFTKAALAEPGWYDSNDCI